MKRAFDWTIANPNRVFVVVFSVMMLLGPGLASVFVYPLSGETWLKDAGLMAQIAGFSMAVVAVRRHAEWLSWTSSLGLTLQAALAGLVLLAPVGAWLGYLHPDPTAFLTSPRAEVVTSACAIAALVCVWGILRNQWWAYFAEVVLIFVVVASDLHWPLPPTPTHQRPERFPGMSAFNAWRDWSLLAFVNWGLIRRGLERWRARYRPVSDVRGK